MTFHEEFEIYLHEMGLSDYEASAYLALLQHGQGTAKEIADTSDIPKSRVYDVLEKLESKGFVTIQMGRPKRYGAIEPDLAVEQYLNYRRNRFDESISKLETIGDQFVSELQSNQFQYKHHDEFDIFWSYEGKNYLLEQGGQLLAHTDSEIRMLTTHDSFRRIVSHHKEVLSKQAEQGVEIRVLVNDLHKLDDVVLETAQEWADIVPISGILGRIYLFDKDRILVTFRNDADTRFVGILTRSSQLYKTLSYLFELTWEEHADSTVVHT